MKLALFLQLTFGTPEGLHPVNRVRLHSLHDDVLAVWPEVHSRITIMREETCRGKGEDLAGGEYWESLFLDDYRQSTISSCGMRLLLVSLCMLKLSCWSQDTKYRASAKSLPVRAY